MELWEGLPNDTLTEQLDVPEASLQTHFPLSSLFKPSLMHERPCEGSRFL